MTSDREPDVALASNFIVELGSGETRSFVICEAKQIVAGDGNWGGVTADEISRFIDRNLLRAAALPGRPLQSSEFRIGPGHDPRHD